MKIKTLLHLIKEITYLRRVLTRCGGSLARGKYLLFDNFRSMSLADEVQQEKAAVYFGQKLESRKAHIAKILNKTNYFSNRNKKTTGEYTAFYSANNFDRYREVKLFSFEKKKILTLCTNAGEAEKQLQQYSALGHAFDMPAVQKADRYPNALEIAMVDLVPRPEEGLALEAICNCVSRYHASHKAETALSPGDILTFPYEAPFHALLEDLSQAIDPAVLEQPIPLCFQHGDLSRDNLIYGTCRDTTDFWWIDWEHARPRLFFYDYFFYILNTAVYFQDTAALRAYLAGDCDDHLDRFFSQFGMTYDRRLRESYFLLFAIAFLKERVCDKDNLQALQMYHTYIRDQVINKE